MLWCVKRLQGPEHLSQVSVNPTGLRGIAQVGGLACGKSLSAADPPHWQQVCCLLHCWKNGVAEGDVASDFSAVLTEGVKLL